jgi:hypothetical protein
MRTKTIIASLALFLAVGALYATDHPLEGTWTLNESKSKLASGMGKNTTVTYQDTIMNKVRVTVEGTGPDGKTTHNEWKGKFDGKDYAVSGDPSSDTRAYTKVDDRTLSMTSKKGGKVVSTGKVVVAPDGKTRTVTISGSSPSGKKYKTKAVYDKTEHPD